MRWFGPAEGASGAGVRQPVGVNLAAHLRSWRPEALTHLLSTRPDLLPAADDGFETLARRAASIPSTGRCLLGVDVGMYVVAEALAVSPPASATELAEVLGTDDLDGTVEALERLAAVGLVTVEDGVAAPVGAVVDLLDRPLGLGPSFVREAQDLEPGVLEDLALALDADGAVSPTATARAVARRLRVPGGMDRLLVDAPTGTADLLEVLLAERSSAIDLPIGHRYRSLDDGEPVGWLLRRGLLVPYDDQLAEPVRELVVAHHPDGLAPHVMLRPVAARSVAGLGVDAVAAAGADQAARTLELVEALIRLVADGEVALRKAGGVGVRELRRLGKRLDVPARDVGRLLELLDEARLVLPVADRLVVADLAEVWGRLSRPRRWLVLVRAWLGADRFLSVAMSEAYDGKPLPALGDVTPVADAFGGRQAVLERLAAVEPGEAVDPEPFTESVVWHRPNVWGVGDPAPAELVAWTLAEADLLGLAAHQAPTPTLLALVGGDDEQAEAAAGAALGADQHQVVLQSDLTALALGPLDPSVAGPLGELADRDREQATPLFRFSESSVRRGLDRGWTPESISAFLDEHALSGVPQPLSYLIDDVARRHGSVRVHGATSVIVTDDEALAVEVASTRRAARLGLRLVAPTVLVGPTDPVRLLDELRAEGFFPVLDGELARIEAAAPDPVAIPDDPHGLPADWTGPALNGVVLATEVAEVVAALADEPDPTAAASAPGAGTASHRLHLLWNRSAVVTHLRRGELVEARGVVVAVDDSVTLLNEHGIERLALTDVVTVEDPSR